jgi:glyoxylase-like metal-dependent hydrolase (beta-lactamase superfamily II)
VSCWCSAPSSRRAWRSSADPIPTSTANRKHHTPDGFRNNYTAIQGGGFWKWQWERWTGSTPQAPPGGWTIPRQTPDVAFLASNHGGPTITWIGHATMLVQVAGRNVLTDPQFTERASPVSFAGPRREVPPAIAVAELPHIDAVLISHNHYDHLDLASLEQLARQPGGAPVFYVPLGLKAWFRRHALPVPVELDWWDQRQDGPLTVHAVPVQHWSARTPWDRNQTLWAGYVVQAPDLCFAFLGDTGYSPDFRDIAARFPHIDSR